MENNCYEEYANNIRKRTLDLVYNAGTSHIGSALSCVDLLTAVYGIVNLEKIKNKAANRDRVILSKGHGISAQLSVLCEFGLLSEDEVKGFCKVGSFYPENTASYTPFIETPTGSLGQGASFAVGAAYGMKLRGYFECRVFVIMGDGELNEGQCWEAFQQASYHKLNNLVVLVDANRLAGINRTCDNQDLCKKMTAFGFQTEILDGHHVVQLMKAMEMKLTVGKPRALICNTVKGYGVSFMENNNDWHYRPISNADYLRAKEEML